ncbi:MAG TPA: hypothetical protein P5186_17575 [Candidatus Paceibacterota bacterium]|nr:hypothetical protein [Verrucomicrobiota bacterium]HRY49862.1 hypothetical protein [Candidatus Paceibacterota bacterium]HSA03427.1 hypothetical protein [Candidatus Paceibacterota bacterium]
MDFVNLILNLAGVLLWFHWRTVGRMRTAPAPGVSLLATLKRAEAAAPARGSPLFGLAALLLIRAFVYWHLGLAMNWTPTIELGAIALPFRSDFFDRVLIFSLASFFLALGIVYLCLLLASTLANRDAEKDPFFKWIQMQLGWIDRWPLTAKLLLPLISVTALWYFLNPVLVMADILPRPLSSTHLWQQALLMGIASYLAWRILIIPLLLLYVINNYVYLGNHPFWNSVNILATNLLRPLAWLPLRLGKLDLAAPLLIVLIFVAAEAGKANLPWVYQQLPIPRP